MSALFLIVGIIVILLTVYLLFKQHDARVVLLGAGLLLCVVGGTPMEGLNAFAKSMTKGGLITSICSCMGFAMVVRFTGCDKHLINALAYVISKVRLFLIPGVVIGTYLVNIAVPSASGTTAAAGTIFIPLLMASGVNPAMAAAAVKCGTYGSMLNPGLAHNAFIAKIASVTPMDVISFHYLASIASVLVAAVVLTIIAYVLKENKGYVADNLKIEEDFKVKAIFALMPIIPLLVLVLGTAGIVPALKMGVPHAMIIGMILTMAVTRMNPVEIGKSFYNGMGKAYGDIMGIIISAGVFVAGLKAIGLVDGFIEVMLNNPAVIKLCAAVGPFLLGALIGSGDAATFAFNEAVTPHAANFGMTIVQMGSMATLGGTLGRTISPIAGATIIAAGIAGVNPMEVAKRNSIPMLCSLVVGMMLLAF